MKIRELISKLREASSGKNYDILVQDDIAGGDYYLGAKILDVDFNITDEGKLVMILKINSQDREEEYFEFKNFDTYLEYKEENDDIDENMNADLETDSLTEDVDLTGKIVKYNGITVKVIRKLTEQEKQRRAHINNPDAGDYYEVETTSKEVGPSKFIVWEARLRDPLTEDVAEDSEDDFVFVSEMRHKDYVIEFFRNKQDGKYYWQAEYDGEDRKFSNFNIWITARGISLYSEDDEGYPTKADVVAKAKEWVNKQKRRWNEGIDKNMNPELEDNGDEEYSDEEDDEDDYSNDYDFYVEYYEGTSPISKFKETFNTLEEAKQYATNNLIKNKKLEIREIYICTEGVNGPVQHDAWFKSSNKWYSEYKHNESDDDTNLIVKY